MSPPSSDHGDSIAEHHDTSKIQGIILASNSTFNISILTAEHSKALLSINGKPLIWHSIKLLTDNGIKDIFVVIEPKYKPALEAAFKDFIDAVTVTIISLDAEVLGSLDALKFLREYITNDFIVIPCDIYGKVDITGLIKSHYQSHSGCTALLYHNEKDTSNSYRCLTLLDEATHKLISIVDSTSFNAGNSLFIHKWHVFSHPNCTIRSDLIDLHVYMFSKALFPAENIDYFSIRFHYIPFLTRSQDMPISRGYLEHSVTDSELDIVDTIKTTSGGLNIFQGESKLDNMHDIGTKYTSVSYYIQYAIGKDECMRINRPETFMHVSLKYLTGNFFENVTIKNSNIAENVKFLGKANVIKSVIMENVTIGNNVILKGCIICSGAVVGDDCQLTDCQIQYSHTIESGTVASKQIFPATDYSL